MSNSRKKNREKNREKGLRLLELYARRFYLGEVLIRTISSGKVPDDCADNLATLNRKGAILTEEAKVEINKLQHRFPEVDFYFDTVGLRKKAKKADEKDFVEAVKVWVF